MDYNESHKALLLSLINSENDLFLTEAATYFDTPFSLDQLGNTRVLCSAVGYDVPATVTYKRIDISILLTNHTQPLILDGLTNGYLSPASPLWGVINSQVPVDVIPFNFDILIAGNTIKLQPVLSSLAFFGEKTYTAIPSVIQPVKIADIYIKNSGKTKDLWFVVRDVLGGDNSLFPYGQNYICTKSMWYPVDASIAAEYADPRYSELKGAVYKIPAGSSAPAGKIITLSQNSNPRDLVSNTALSFSDGTRHQAIMVREEAGLPTDLRFATTQGADVLVLHIH